MATIQFSAVVDDARGSLGGLTFSRNRYGAYVRSRTAPVQPRTAAQTAVRNQFTAFSTSWRILSPAQQTQWNVFAGIQPTLNRLGRTRFLSGAQWYVKLNMIRYSLGLAEIVSPPPPGPIFAIPTATATADQSANTVVILTTGSGGGGDFVQVFATPPLSPGVSFTGKSQYRYMGFFAGSADTLSITAAYIAVFGGLGGYTPGQVIHYRLVPTDANGTPGTEFKFAAAIVN